MDLVVAAKTYSALFGTKRPRSGSKPLDPENEGQGDLKEDLELVQPAEIPIYVSRDSQTELQDARHSPTFVSSLCQTDPLEFHQASPLEFHQASPLEFHHSVDGANGYDENDLLQTTCDHGFSSSPDRSLDIGQEEPDAYAEETVAEVLPERLHLVSSEGEGGSSSSSSIRRRLRRRRNSMDQYTGIQEQRFQIMCKACGERMTVIVTGRRVRVEPYRNLFHSFDETLQQRAHLYPVPAYSSSRSWSTRSSPGHLTPGGPPRSYSSYRTSASYLTANESLVNSVFSSPGYLSPDMEHPQNESFTTASSAGYYDTPELELNEESTLTTSQSLEEAEIGQQPKDDFYNTFMKVKSEDISEAESEANSLQVFVTDASSNNEEDGEISLALSTSIMANEDAIKDQEVVQISKEELIDFEDAVSTTDTSVKNTFITVQTQPDSDGITYSSAKENFDEGNIALAAHWEKVKDKILAQKEAFQSFDCLDTFSGIVAIENGGEEMASIDQSEAGRERVETVSSTDSALGSSSSDKDESSERVYSSGQQRPHDSAVFDPFATIEDYSESGDREGTNSKQEKLHHTILGHSQDTDDGNLSDDTIVNDLIEINQMEDDKGLTENSSNISDVSTAEGDGSPLLHQAGYCFQDDSLPNESGYGTLLDSQLLYGSEGQEKASEELIYGIESIEPVSSKIITREDRMIDSGEEKKESESDMGENDKSWEDTDLKLAEHVLYIPNYERNGKVKETGELVEVNEPLIIEEKAKKKEVTIVEHLVGGYSEVRLPSKDSKLTFKSEVGMFVPPNVTEELKDDLQDDNQVKPDICTRDEGIQCNIGSNLGMENAIHLLPEVVDHKEEVTVEKLTEEIVQQPGEVSFVDGTAQTELRTIDDSVQCEIEDKVQTADQMVQFNGEISCLNESETQTEIETAHVSVQCDTINSGNSLKFENGTEFETFTQDQSVQCGLPTEDVGIQAPEGESLLSTQRSFEVRQIGVPGSEDGDGTGQVDIDLKYSDGSEQIQQLELQLARRGGETVPNLEELKALKVENKSLKEEINELNRILTEKDIVAKSLQQEKSLGKERNAHLQHEINRLRQEWLTLKDGLSSEQQNVGRYIDQIDAQQRELEKYKKEACDLKEILIEEQEKFRFCDYEKQLLSKEVERSRSDSGRMNFDKAALEEKNIALQGELARLKEECNQMTVDKSKYKALLEELKADRDRQRDGLVSRDDLNVQLKELLHDNQEAAEKLRAELQRLNGELEDKNHNITRLKTKLDRVQRKYQIPSTDLNSEPGDFDHIQSPPPQNHRRPPTGNGAIESVSASFGNGSSNHKSEFHTVLGEKGEEVNDKNRGSLKRDPSPARRKTSSERSSLYNGSRSRESSPVGGSPYSNRGDDSTFIADRSAREDGLQKEIYLLNGQLRASRDLNDALKKELSLFDTLSRNSIGVQNSPKMGSLSTQVGASNGHTAGGDLSLREHLEEIRALRLRLEESIQQNNKLRELLQKQLAQAGLDTDAVAEYLRKPRSVSFGSVSGGGGTTEVQEMNKELELLQQEVQAKNREIDSLTRELQEVRRDVLKKDQIFLELEDRVKTKDHTLQMLTMDSENRNKQLRAARQEVKRLKEEMNVTRADAEEQTELNKTLRLELSVYDKMGHNDSHNGGSTDTTGGGNIDLHLLLQEIRQLRIQLEKCIDNNNLLRQKLEEQLHRGMSPRSQNRSPRSSLPSPASTLTFNDKEGDTLSRDGSPDAERMDGSFGKRTRNRHGYSVRFHDSPSPPSPPAVAPGGFKYNGGATSSTLDSGMGSSTSANELADPLYGLLGETYLDRYFARKGMLGSEGENSPTARTRSAGRSPAGSRSRTPVPSSPPTKLDRSLSADREKYTSPRSSRPNSRGPNEDPLHRSELTNGHGVLSSPEFAREGYSMEDPLHSTLGSSYRVTSPDALKLNGYVPGSSDGAMRYSILDPARPPKRSPSNADSDIEYLQEGSTAVRVGSDLRQLYAIGELDDYELLKKEIGESHCILNGMEARVRERMRGYSQRSQGESTEYQILREMVSSIHQCKTLNSEAGRLVSLFWMSQLPLRDEHGNFVDVKMLKQNQGLQDELLKYKRECTRLKVQLRDANSHMEISSRSRDGMEQELFRQLNDHHHTLRKTNHNLEKFATGKPLAYR